MLSNPAPFRDLPIRIWDGHVEIAGRIPTLFPNDIEVEITSPVGGLRTSLHVPHFAMYPVNWLATFGNGRTLEITPRGQQKAEELLRELSARSHGRGSGWPVERRTPAGHWVESEPDGMSSS